MISIIAKRYYIEHGYEIKQHLLRQVVQDSFPPYLLTTIAEDELIKSVTAAFNTVRFFVNSVSWVISLNSARASWLQNHSSSCENVCKNQHDWTPIQISCFPVLTLLREKFRQQTAQLAKFRGWENLEPPVTVICWGSGLRFSNSMSFTVCQFIEHVLVRRSI